MKRIASGTVTITSIQPLDVAEDQAVLDDVGLFAEMLQWLCRANQKPGHPSPYLTYCLLSHEGEYACVSERPIEHPADAHPTDYDPQLGQWTPILSLGKGQTAQAAIHEAAQKLRRGASRWGWLWDEPLHGWPVRYSFLLGYSDSSMYLDPDGIEGIHWGKLEV